MNLWEIAALVSAALAAAVIIYANRHKDEEFK